MQNADRVLSILRTNTAKDHDYRPKRLYRLLYNVDLYRVAWIRWMGLRPFYGSSEGGARFPEEAVAERIALLREERYRPPERLARQAAGGTAGGTADRLVADAVGMIGEAVQRTWRHRLLHSLPYPTPVHRFLMEVARRGGAAPWMVLCRIGGCADSGAILPEELIDQLGDGRFGPLLQHYLSHPDIPGMLTGAPLRRHPMVRLLQEAVWSRCCRVCESQVRHCAAAGPVMVVFGAGGTRLAGETAAAVESCCRTLGIVLSEPPLVVDAHRMSLELFGYRVVRPGGGEEPRLDLPRSTVQQALAPYLREGRPVHAGWLVNRTAGEAIARYAAELQRFHRFCSLAWNCNRRLRGFRKLHLASLARTLARKEQVSVREIYRRYGCRRPDRNGEPRVTLACSADGREAAYPVGPFPPRGGPPIGEPQAGPDGREAVRGMLWLESRMR